MATQRAVSVTWPHHVTRWYTNRRVRIVIAAIVVALCLYYAHLLYGGEVVGKGICTSKDQSYENFLRWFAKVDAIVSLGLPLLLLLIANTVLIWKLRESTSAPTEGVIAKDAARVKKVNSVTLTTVAVSLAYIVLTMPMTVYMMTSYISIDATTITPNFVRTVLFQRSSLIVLYFNYAVNFYLYCLTGSKFRAQFFRLVSCFTSRAKTPA
jgi:hypothetical protein